MTNLKIAFNDIPEKCKTLTSDNTTNEVYNYFNLLSNKKYHYIKLDSGATTQTFTFDLGEDASGDITATSEYFLFNAKQIDQTNLTDIKLEGSSNGSTWNTIDTVIPAELASLKGYYESDYIITFTESTAYRYWRVVQTTSSSATGNWGKFYFGKFLDLEREPDDIELNSDRTESRFETDSGSKRIKKTKNDIHNITITWKGISDTKLAEFETIIKEQPEALVWLYCENDASFFDGVDLVSCNIQKVDIERQTNYNEIKVDFVEAI